MDTRSRAANHSAAVFRAIIAPSGAYPSEFNRVVFFAESTSRNDVRGPEQSAVAAIDDGSPLTESNSIARNRVASAFEISRMQ